MLFRRDVILFRRDVFEDTEGLCEYMERCQICFFSKKMARWKRVFGQSREMDSKSPVFLGENQEFSIFWPKNRAFFPITTGLISPFPWTVGVLVDIITHIFK